MNEEFECEILLDGIIDCYCELEKGQRFKRYNIRTKKKEEEVLEELVQF